MRTNELTGPMQKIEASLDRPLRVWLEERYAVGTLDDVAADIAKLGYKVDRTTVAVWMDRLGLERRFPGQRPASPEAVA